MSKYITFLGMDGKKYRAEKKGYDSALSVINDMIDGVMPLETVNIEKVKNLIQEVHVEFKRDMTALEAMAVIEAIKDALVKEVDKLQKYYVSRNDIIVEDKSAT